MANTDDYVVHSVEGVLSDDEQLWELASEDPVSSDFDIDIDGKDEGTLSDVVTCEAGVTCRDDNGVEYTDDDFLQQVQIHEKLATEQVNELKGLLLRNRDVFVWKNRAQMNFGATQTN